MGDYKISSSILAPTQNLLMGLGMMVLLCFNVLFICTAGTGDRCHAASEFMGPLNICAALRTSTDENLAGEPKLFCRGDEFARRISAAVSAK